VASSYQLYHFDSYLREVDALVTGVEDARVTLSQTVFYAQGGGQPADHGTLRWPGGEAMVVDVRHQGHEVWHQLVGALPALGTRIHGMLDWDRRYALMRMHTALHILNGVIWRDYGAKVTGVSMEPGSARIDFELERMTSDFASEVETRVNVEIAANRAINVRFFSREEALALPDLVRSKINLLPEGLTEVRAVEIIGLDLQADGGTHVAHTGEVGRLRVVGHQSKGRINKRLRVTLEP
jgi:misacylated tRNA(Ala) deacylase